MKKTKILFSLMIVFTMLITSVTVNASTINFYVLGDIDNNGRLNVDDVTIAQKYLVRLVSDAEINTDLLDFNGDGKNNIYDVTEIQRKLANMDYNCCIFPDDDYLSAHLYNSIDFVPLEGELNFEEILCSRNLFLGCSPSYNTRDIALITNMGEYYSFMGCYSPEFNEEFFKKKSLVIALKQEYDFESQNRIDFIGVQNNTLYVYARYSRPDGPLSPMAPVWIMIYSVNKSDIENVANIICTSRGINQN